MAKGHFGLVDHSDDIGAQPGLARDPLVERSVKVPAVLAGSLRPQLSLLVWLARNTVGSIKGLIIVAVLGAGLVAVYFAKGPIAVAGLAPRITQALNQNIGHGYAFKVGGVSVTAHGFGPTLAIDHLTLTSSSGETIISAPHAEVSVGLLDLLVGKVVPKRLEVFDIEVRLALLPDGSLAVSANNGSQGTLPLLGPLSAAMSANGTSGRRPALASPLSASTPVSSLPPRSLIVKRIAAAMRLLIDISTRPSGPLAAIDRVGIQRGRFVIEDQLNDQKKVYNGLTLSLGKFGGTNLELSADGPSGPWSIFARASGKPGNNRRLDVAFKNISLDEISLVSGMRNVGADFDTPVSSKFTMVLAADGGLSDVDGQVHFDPGYLRFADPNDEPRLIDSIDTAFHWDRGARRIALDNLHLRTGETDLGVSGVVAPPIREGDPWTIDLTNSQRGIYGPERPGEDDIVLDHVGLQGRLSFEDKSFFIDRFAFDGPKCGLAMAGVIDWKNGPHLRIGASVSPTPAAIAVRLWPSFMAPDIRAWFLAHWRDGIIQRGTIQVDFNAAMIDSMRRQHPPPDSALAIDFAITNGAVDFLPGVPPLQGIDGTGHITGRTSTFIATKGSMDLGAAGTLTMSQGTFHIAHAQIKPTPAVLTAQVAGNVEAVSDLLSRDALKPYASLPVDPSTLKGQIAGMLGVGLRLGPGARPQDTKLAINANVGDFSADKLVGDQKLDDGTLNVVVDAAGMHTKGQGHIFGTNANLDIERLAGSKAGQATISFVMDDAMRAKQGINILPGLSGPLGTKLTAPLGATGPIKAQVELDLTHAVMAGTLGISKPAGRPGKADFALAVNEDHSTSLDQMVIDAAPLFARGSVLIGGADPSHVSGKFSLLRLSAGDDMKVDFSKSGDVLKIVAHGTTLDARPFLKNLTFAHSDEAQDTSASDDKDSDKASAEESPKATTMDIDLKTTTLSGYNKQAMSNVDLHMVKTGETLKQFSLSGHFGHGPISGKLNGTDTPSPQLDLSTEDAGALLAFVDLYKHMAGGNLSVSIRLGDDAMAGALAIRSFVLRDEPALQRLVAEGAAQNIHGVRHINPVAVPFDLLQVNFQRAGSRLDLREGTMYGSEIGLTVDGWLDFARDRVSLDGTYVPAYAVNNIPSQIPLFGLLLGGGVHEGVFGVNYHIGGAATKPTLNVNLFSAIAPGFLRKIFGFADFPDSTTEPSTQSIEPGESLR